MKKSCLKVWLATTALFGSVSVGFGLPDCHGNESVSWDLCVGTQTYLNGSRYLGEWKDGKRHGKGIEDDINGNISEGIYRNDIAQERLKTSYSFELVLLKISFKKLSKEKRKSIQSNLKKIGLYKSSIDGLYGKGTEGALIAFNAQNLGGESLKKSKNVVKLFSAVAGLKEELLTITQTEKTNLPKRNSALDEKNSNNCIGKFSKSGIDCIGIVHNGMANGQGTFTYSDGSEYLGEFEDCRRQGQGIFTFGTETLFAGNKYVGEFKNDKYYGQGIFIFGTKSEFSGDKYFGEFRNNKKNGHGTYTYGDGSKYVGEYKDDKKNGRGAFSHADGSKYIGDWQDGKANGKGTHILADGSKYVGQYRNGEPYGKSTKIWSNGTAIEGIWIEGLFVFE